MTYIATGESGELGDEGLLADGRHQPHVDLPTERSTCRSAERSFCRP
jgi:hypothetical protein